MNYKPYGYASVGKDIVHSVPFQEIKTLSFVFAGSSAEKSLKVEASTTVYQVPTGKKFVILTWMVSHKNTATNPTLFIGDTLNALTTLIYGIKTTGGHAMDTVSFHAEVPAGKWITCDPVSIEIHWTQVVGYETDA